MSHLVDDHEAARVPVFAVWIERDRSIKADVADADFVHLKRVGRKVAECVHVDAIFWISNRYADRACPDSHQVRAPRKHPVLVHPDHMGFELIGDFCRVVGVADHVPA